VSARFNFGQTVRQQAKPAGDAAARILGEK
jgi:hypothetical protein